MARWLPTLEKKIEQYSVDSHPAYRVYMSAEPASSRESHTIPQGILEVSIKITNEPPTGMMANLHKALDNFNQVYSVATGNRLCRNEWTNQSGGMIFFLFSFELIFGLSYTVLKGNSGIWYIRNKVISLWNCVPNPGLRKFRHGISIIDT